MRDCRIANVSLIGRVEQNDRSVGQRVLYPSLKLGPRGRGPGGVVRRAQVNDVHVLLGRLRDEPVLGRAWQVSNPCVGTRGIGLARVARHDVGIHINGVHWIGDGQTIGSPHDVEDRPAIALRTVAHKDLIVGHVEAVGPEIILGNGRPQPLVALLGAIALEGAPHGHLIHRLVQGGNHGCRQRLGHVADAAPNQPGGRCRIGVIERLHPPSDFRKQITRLELEIIVVE